MEFTLFSMHYHFLVSHWSLSFHRCTKSDFLVSTSTEHLKQWILHGKSSLKWRSSKTLIHKWTKRQPVVSKTSIPSSLVTLGGTHQHSFEISVPVLIFITDSCLFLCHISPLGLYLFSLFHMVWNRLQVAFWGTLRKHVRRGALPCIACSQSHRVCVFCLPFSSLVEIKDYLSAKYEGPGKQWFMIITMVI